MDVEVKGEKGRKKKSGLDVEEFREIITLFSDKVPGLVKGLVTSIFSEDAARGMAKAGATYYQELKAGGIPDDVAVQMTKEYLGTFTKMSEMFRSSSKGFAPKVQFDKSKREEDEDKE